MDAARIGLTLTDENFQTMVLESAQPVLVAFWSEGCGPWHLLAPELAALAEAFRGRAAVATLDVEAAPQIPKHYGIETLPAVLFFQDGEIVDRLTGVVDKAEMAAKLHALTETGQAWPLDLSNTRREGTRGEMLETPPWALVSMTRQREDGTYGTWAPVAADRLSEALRVRCVEAIARSRAAHGTAPHALTIESTGYRRASDHTG